MNKRTLHSLGIALVATATLVPVQADAWTIKVTGTIFDLPDGSSASTDGFGLFGTANAALAGGSYTETITTDPLLNSTIQCATATCLGTIGASGPGLSAGPYTLTVTVNGVSFVHDALAPSLNSAQLVNSLSAHDPTDPAPYDLLSQSVGSGDCYDAPGGLCLFTTVQALSSWLPFVPTLDFNQTMTVAGGFNYEDTGSFTAFEVFDGQSPQQETDFYGTIDTLSVNPKVAVPEPGTLPLLAVGLVWIGFVLRRKTSQSVKSAEFGVLRSR
jgi:hypothetical protein